jgi:hypothetical protein
VRSEVIQKIGEENETEAGQVNAGDSEQAFVEQAVVPKATEHANVD